VPTPEDSLFDDLFEFPSEENSASDHQTFNEFDIFGEGESGVPDEKNSADTSFPDLDLNAAAGFAASGQNSEPGDFSDFSADLPFPASDVTVEGIEIEETESSDIPVTVIPEEPVSPAGNAKKKKEKPVKEKKSKPAKEKKPRTPREKTPGRPFNKVALCIALVFLAVFALINVYAFLTYALKSILFLILFDIFAAGVVTIPLIFAKSSVPLSFYDTCLAISLVAILLSCMLLLVRLADYGGNIKAKNAGINITLPDFSPSYFV
jgi:hypothetical protein